MRKEVCSVFFIYLNLLTSFHEDMQRGMEIEAIPIQYSRLKEIISEAFQAFDNSQKLLKITQARSNQTAFDITATETFT